MVTARDLPDPGAGRKHGLLSHVRKRPQRDEEMTSPAVSKLQTSDP